jgi:divalent metal cation (Fe/Co/Zn/Cd) transporter
MPSPSERPRQSRGSAFKAAYVSAMLNAALMTLQIVIGLFAHSDGLVADGIHTLSDLAADGVVIAVLFLGPAAASGRRAASADGSMHATLASLFIGTLLIGTAGEMLWHSIQPAAILTVSATVRASALVVAIFVMFAKEALFRYMYRSEPIPAFYSPARGTPGSTRCPRWSPRWGFSAAWPACRCSITSPRASSA